MRSREQRGSHLNAYYVAEVRCVLDRAPTMSATVTVRPIVQADVPMLAELYLRSYESGIESLDDANAEMRSAFEGTWGVLWPEASPSAWIGHELVGTCRVMRVAGEDRVGLTVDDDNIPALALYRSLGFSKEM